MSKTQQITWLSKMGFVSLGVSRKPRIGEWYIDKNSERLCFVYNKDSIPCDCEKCKYGYRLIVIPYSKKEI